MSYCFAAANKPVTNTLIYSGANRVMDALTELNRLQAELAVAEAALIKAEAEGGDTAELASKYDTAERQLMDCYRQHWSA